MPNMYSELPSGTMFLNIMNYVRTFSYEYFNITCIGVAYALEAERMRRLVRAFPAHRRYKYQNLYCQL